MFHPQLLETFNLESHKEILLLTQVLNSLVVSTNTLTHALKTKHEIKTGKMGLETYVSAADLQQVSAQVYTLSSHFTPPNEKKMCFSTHRSSRISDSGGHGTKRPAVYSLPTSGVWQQLFGHSSSCSSFESMKQQVPYKSNEMSRFDMLLKSKLPRNHVSTLVSVVNALGLSVNISDLENPKDMSYLTISITFLMKFTSDVQTH